MKLFAAVVLSAALGGTPVCSAPPQFGDEKTSWHGFDRYDFLMDDSDLTIKPHKAGGDEGNAVKTQVKGHFRCVVVAPKQPATGNPWSWRGYYWDHEPQTEIELLKRGFHIGFIWCDAGKPWDAWYKFLTETHGLSKKPAFVGMSRGGRNAYTWAIANPDKVSCIYVDNPAVSKEAVALLGGLARADVPVLHVCGSLDPILGNHTLVVEAVYQQLGGRISVMVKDGAAHHPHSLRDPRPIADFIEAGQKSVAADPPAFAGKAFTRTSFYGSASDYRDVPGEKTFAACRGPWFALSYDRYEFRPDGIRMPVSVIVPKAPAPGKPWVFRGDFVTRDATVDLALLGRGFHIVTGPVPTDTDGPVLSQWNAVYKLLTDAGLSKTPVLEGAGGAAGEAYAWAIENPDKVSCVYAENPILRSHMSKAQPLDRLAPLAKAGVPVLHVCGSRDPWLESQTRVLEKRYTDLGGAVTVVVDEGKGHYPTAPRDVKTVVDYIVSRQAAARPTPEDPAAGRGGAGPALGARLQVRPDDLPLSVGELPVPGDLGRGHPQRPGRPQRQRPDAQGHRGQVRRPGDFRVFVQFRIPQVNPLLELWPCLGHAHRGDHPFQVLFQSRVTTGRAGSQPLEQLLAGLPLLLANRFEFFEQIGVNAIVGQVDR
jgi:pimeloyl-ACP methyl ester carboxylesterase